ncbi:hypothetical protein FHR34_001833 [Kitasatospora kifunensis]|uniref:Uncharacterized protein n=1 Tax=Kitasatospora kifunensis TaxID=58351 RepID=A0A7W7QZT1_KITKI|nr:hypothetical protein [Kitasatospora kifunensis]
MLCLRQILKTHQITDCRSPLRQITAVNSLVTQDTKCRAGPCSTNTPSFPFSFEPM